MTIIKTPSQIKEFSGPAEYYGPIGKLLSNDLWELPVGEFTPLHCPDFPTVSEKVWKKFSNYVRYLYCIAGTAVTGKYTQFIL